MAQDSKRYRPTMVVFVKPLVYSMSDAAASGGYYMAMTGDPIVALARAWKRLTGAATHDLRRPAPVLNRALERLFSLEAFADRFERIYDEAIALQGARP